VGLGFTRADDVGGDEAADEERVGDKGAVAAPGNGFGAHDDRGFLRCEVDQLGEGSGEFGSLHVIGETAKAVIFPFCIDGIFVWVAKAAEFIEVEIFDASIGY